ncbi:MAG: hypothetical protein EOP84_23245 [Verrucomicrobiaceae bacterium]|nr:MAG: hypothetical protein EOP84_23245 [Verrucomicrobiaceae bacterium]
MREESHIPSSYGTSGGFLRVILFVCLCAFSGIGIVGYALHSPQRSLPEGVASTPIESVNPGRLLQVRQRPHLLFRSTALGPSYGFLSVAGLDAMDGARHVTAISCERVYGSASSGLCLQASRGVFTTYQAIVFDQSFNTQQILSLSGAPSRTRVSRNGRMGAITVFVKGDSYNSGGFSTRTSLIDLVSKQVIGDLEAFPVTKDGQPFRKVDFNFWGVTFAPGGDRFFATLGSGGVLYLVEGEISKRSLRVVREGVECPSLSPDGTRIAFKARATESGRFMWRVRVWDIRTGTETAINETRSVDDQVEWLDSEHVLYGLPRELDGSASADIWTARVDGKGTPRVFLADALSPCVIRP